MIRTIGELKKAIEELDDDDFIYALSYPERKRQDILNVEDSTSFGFWEIRLSDEFTLFNNPPNIEKD